MFHQFAGPENIVVMTWTYLQKSEQLGWNEFVVVDIAESCIPVPDILLSFPCILQNRS